MSTMASQITSHRIVCWTVYSGADQRKHQSSTSLAFVMGIHRGPVNAPHKWPVTRKMFPFDDVIMLNRKWPEWQSDDKELFINNIQFRVLLTWMRYFFLCHMRRTWSIRRSHWYEVSRQFSLANVDRDWTNIQKVYKRLQSLVGG